MTEAELAEEALSITTLGTQGEVALQIATNGVRTGQKAERAAVVAWLRDEIREWSAQSEGLVAAAFAGLARAIERGDHLAEKGE